MKENSAREQLLLFIELVEHYPWYKMHRYNDCRMSRHPLGIELMSYLLSVPVLCMSCNLNEDFAMLPCFEQELALQQAQAASN